MKAYTAGLLNQVVNAYDKTKTTIAGRVFQKTVNGQTVLGPPLTSFIDVQNTAGFIPSIASFNALTNRLFVLQAAASGGAPSVALYNFNATTGTYSYVGYVTLRLANTAATTHTFRGFKVDDSNASNIKIFLSTTGSIAVNGGTYMAYGLGLADFSFAGTALWPAQGTGQKAVYFLQDPSAVGAANAATSSWGVSTSFNSSNAAYNTKVMQINGTVSAPVVYVWDYATVPQVANTLTVASNTMSMGSPAAYFNSGSVNPGLATGDQVVFTAAAPANFVSSPGTAAQTVYFVRDVQNVLGTWFFNLALTSAGSAVVPTSTVTGMTLMRAFGISTNGFSFKTGVLGPALAGGILQANSFGYCAPTLVPSNPALNGQECLYVATTTMLYLFRLNEITNGATAWSVAPGATAAGTGADITAPTVAYAAYSSSLDRWVYLTNTSTFVIKPSQSGVISQVFGGLSNQFMEGSTQQTFPASMANVVGLEVEGGWLFMSGNTVGQRGLIAVDIRSDNAYGYSWVTSPVLSAPIGSIMRWSQLIEQLFDYTDSTNLQIRSATSASDAIFNNPNSGWVELPPAKDFNATINQYFQFRIGYYINTFFANSPAQVNEIQYCLQQLFEMSDNWAFDNDNSTVGLNTPSYVAGLLALAYQVAVPTIYVRGYDLAGNQLFIYNTSANPTLFQYSTNGGTSWTALGTIPNVVGTRLRLNVASPPNQVAVVVFGES